MSAVAGALLALLVAAGCAGSARGPAQDGVGPADRGVTELRVRLAADPRDGELHRALARALLESGRPGGALRHYERAARHGQLGAADRSRLAALYLERAASRIRLADGDAWRDVDRAIRLDPAPVTARPEVRREAYFAGALAGFRRADRPGRARAARLLRRASELAPADHRLAALDPRAADLAQLAGAGAWLADGGARRAALELFQIYVDRGGRVPAHARRYLTLHRWWYGDRERPSGLLLDDLRRAGLDLCAFARRPGDLGCAGATARAAAEPTGHAAVAIRRIARRRAWRVTDPDQIAAWAVLAVAAQVTGEAASFGDELAVRIDVAAMAAPAAVARVPAHVLPTVLRLAGRSGQASAAFDRVSEHAAALSPEERVVLVAEAAATGRSEGTLDRLLHGGAAPPLGWRLALAAARAREPGSPRELALLEQAPAEVAIEHLRGAGALGALAVRLPSPAHDAALARWRAALTAPVLAPGRAAVEERWRRLTVSGARPTTGSLPLGTIDPYRLTEDAKLAGELTRIVRSWRRSPAASDRLAQDFLDGGHATGERGLLVVELFLRLDDPARAWRFAERLAASSTHHPDYLLAAGVVSAAAGAVDRADLFFVRGAAASGDAGAASLLAARVFLAFDQLLPALTAARRALQLTAPGEDEHHEAIELTALALARLGRDQSAAQLRARLPGERAPVVVQDPLAALEPGTASWSEALASQLALALVAPPERAAPVLDAIARALDRAGLERLAGQVRRERRALAPLAPR